MSPAEQIFCVLSQLNLWHIIKKNAPVCFPFRLFLKSSLSVTPILFGSNLCGYARLHLCAFLSAASSGETAPRVHSSAVPSPWCPTKICDWAKMLLRALRGCEIYFGRFEGNVHSVGFALLPVTCRTRVTFSTPAVPHPSQMFQFSTQKTTFVMDKQRIWHQFHSIFTVNISIHLLLHLLPVTQTGWLHLRESAHPACLTGPQLLQNKSLPSPKSHSTHRDSSPTSCPLVVQPTADS